MIQWGPEGLLFLPRASTGRVDWLLLRKVETRDGVAVAVASTLSGFPAGLGSQFSLYPGDRRQGRKSSEGTEDTRE